MHCGATEWAYKSWSPDMGGGTRVFQTMIFILCKITYFSFMTFWSYRWIELIFPSLVFHSWAHSLSTFFGYLSKDMQKLSVSVHWWVTFAHVFFSLWIFMIAFKLVWGHNEKLVLPGMTTDSFKTQCYIMTCNMIHLPGVKTAVSRRDSGDLLVARAHETHVFVGLNWAKCFISPSASLQKINKVMKDKPLEKDRLPSLVIWWICGCDVKSPLPDGAEGSWSAPAHCVEPSVWQ